MKSIIVDGIEYVAKVQEPEASQNANSEVVPSKSTSNTSVLDDYAPFEVKDAVPKLSDYRERYKKRKVYMNEVKVQQKMMRELPKQDRELDSFSHKGDRLFFGEGISQD